MMWVKNEIWLAAAQLKIEVTELSYEDTEAALGLLERTFGRPGTDPLWERIRGGEEIHDSNAWRRIPEYVENAALLLVEDAQGKCGFRFASGLDLCRTLAECVAFEFYITDEHAAYLLAFNHHDILIGVGDAMSWVRSLRESRKG